MQDQVISIVADGANESIVMVCYFLSQGVGKINFYPIEHLSWADEQRVISTFKSFMLNDGQVIHFHRPFAQGLDYGKIDNSDFSVLIYRSDTPKQDVRAVLRDIAERKNRDFIFYNHSVYDSVLTGIMSLITK